MISELHIWNYHHLIHQVKADVTNTPSSCVNGIHRTVFRLIVKHEERAYIFRVSTPDKMLFLPQIRPILLTNKGILLRFANWKGKNMILDYRQLCTICWYHPETDSFNHTAPSGVALKGKLKREILPMGKTPYGPYCQEAERKWDTYHFLNGI